MAKYNAPKQLCKSEKTPGHCQGREKNLSYLPRTASWEYDNNDHQTDEVSNMGICQCRHFYALPKNKRSYRKDLSLR